MTSSTKCIVSLIVVICLLGSKPLIAETIRFRTADFVPYVLKNDKSGRPGLLIEINLAIVDKANLGIENQAVPIARLLKDLQNNFTDCAIFLLSPWSKARFIAVAKVYDQFDSIVVTRKGLKIKRLEDLHGQLLALARGSYVDFPISTDPNIRRHYTDGYTQSARLLKAGRVDAIAGTALSIFHNLATLDIQRKDIESISTFDSKSIWLQCAKQQLSDDVVMQLRQATNILRSEGAFRDLRDRYIPKGFE